VGRPLQNYLNSFFQSVGGSPWANIQTQYCAFALPGSTSCLGGAGFVTNPKGQLKGTWTDPSAVPDDITAYGLAENLVDDPIATEAVRAAQHFGYNRDATYVILTPPSTIATGQPVYCGYHTQTSSVDGLGNPERIQYAFIPWLNENWPGLGANGCGMHNVNATSDAFGNGVFDGYSIVTGHEYAEAVTDPDNVTSFQDGWNDDQTSENGDKCAWLDTQNITLGAHQFAVQPLWSNKAFDATGNGCVVAGP
jgi:serine protease